MVAMILAGPWHRQPSLSGLNAQKSNCICRTTILLPSKCGVGKNTYQPQPVHEVSSRAGVYDCAGRRWTRVQAHRRVAFLV